MGKNADFGAFLLGYVWGRGHCFTKGPTGLRWGRGEMGIGEVGRREKLGSEKVGMT